MNNPEYFRFDTGAKRSLDAIGEGWDLVPIIGLQRVAKVAAYGAEKYGKGNWLKGIPVSDCVRRAIRHSYLHILGDKSEDHLAHGAWDLLAACHFEVVRPDLNDIVFQLKPEELELLKNFLTSYNGGERK